MTRSSPRRLRHARRSQFVLEALEPRVLLSADFTAAQAATLGSGLQGLSDWANGLDNFSSLAQPLPVYVQSAADAPKTFTTIGSKVDLGGLIGSKLAAPLNSYFAAHPNDATLSGLVSALTSSGVVVSNASNAGEIALDVQLDAPVAATTQKIDLDNAANGIQAQTTLSVSEHTKFDFTFGVDLTPGLSAPEAFFIRVTDLTLSADAHQANIAAFAGRVGFLDATFGDGSATSKIDFDADVGVAFTNAGVIADGKVSLSELQGVELANLVTLNVAGALNVNLPVKATLGTFMPSGTMTITDANVFDGVLAAPSLSGFVDMLKFNNVGSNQVLALADEFGVWLNNFQQLDSLKFDVPFVSGESLASLDDFGSVFGSKLLADAVGTGLKQQVTQAGPDGSGEVLPDTPNFRSAQELATRLASALGLTAASVAADYNAATSELTYHLKLTTTASENATLGLDIPDAGSLNGASTSNVPSLAETGTFDFTFGIDLSPLAGAGDSLERHFFVRNGSLKADVAITVPNIVATARFGLVDLTLAGTAGSAGSVTLTKNLIDPVSAGPRVTLDTLLGNVFHTPPNLTDAGAKSGSTHLDLNVTAASPSAVVGTLSGTPSITLTKVTPDAAATFASDTDFAPLLRFANLGASDIVAALQNADAYLTKIATLGALGAPLPVIGVSAGDFLHLADALDSTIAGLQANPPQSLASVASSVSAALTAAGKTGVVVSFAADGANALKLSLQFNSTTGSKVALGLDLAGLASIADQGTHNADDQVGLVDVSAPANRIDLEGSASYKLDLGIDLSNPAQPTPFIYDSSSLTLGLHVAETALNLALAAGPLQIAVSGGNVLIDKDGAGGTADPATFAVDVMDPGASPNGRITPDELPLVDAATDIGVVLTGQIHATLPTSFGNPVQGGNLSLDINNLGNELAHQAQSVNFLGIPDFSSQLNTGAVASNLGVIADGLDSLLKTLQAALNQQVFGKDLPLVGDNLASLGTGVIDKFRNDFINAFKTALGSNPDETAVKSALFTVLHDQLGVLGDTDGANGITADDVQLTDVAGLPEFRFLLVEPVFTASTNLGFDLGLPGLGLKSDAKVKADLSFNWMVDFGVSLSDGFFLNTAANNELDLKLALTVPNAAASGDLAFLHLAITDKGSNLTGDIKVDLKDADNHLTLADIASGGILESLLSPAMSIQSKVDLNLNLSFAGNFVLPSFNSEFLMQWDFDAANPESAAAGPSVLQFKDVTLELGSFVSDFLKPVVDEIKKVFDPIKPVLDFLTDPIPVLSDIPGLKELLGDGGVSPDPAKGLELLEIAARVGGIFAIPPQIFDAIAVIDKVNDIANLLSAPNPMNQLGINLGTFDIASALADQGGDARDAGGLDNLQISALGFDPITKVKNFVDGALPANDILRQATDKLFTSAQRAFNLGSTPGANDLSFPVLDDPTVLFGLLLGRDVNLFQLDLAPFSVDTGLINQTVPLLGPLSIGLFGNLNISGDFAFGYDTHGLVEFADKLASGGGLHPELFADGFFVSDTGNPQGTGPDIPELTVLGAVGVKGQVSTPVAALGAEGGVFANLTVNLDDENHDGKVRGSEIADAVAQGPLCLFDTSGDVHAGIHAYVKVGFDTPLGFVTLYEDGFDIATVKILDLAHDCNTTPPVLATPSGGDLILNIGTRAGIRGGGTEGVIDENYAIRQLGNGDIEVSAFGFTQTFSGITHITGDADSGNDSIVLDPSVKVSAKLNGGSGDDLLVGGSANDDLSGGTGKDTLLGGGGDDTVRGQEDNDLIFGNAGADRLDGGPGDDRIYGGNGTDQVDNTGDGADVIFGGPGNDNLYGNLGDDKIWGGAGNDQLYGGDGNDILAGGNNDDLIEGGLGADQIYGDADLDVTTLAVIDTTGYLGNDALFGDARTPNHPNLSDGNDTLFGAGGSDLVVGNDGNDELHGGDGNDRLQGNAGDDRLFGDNQDDVLSGGIGNDQLFGGDGNDQMFGDERIAAGAETSLQAGQTDDDYFEGGKGNDTMFGGAGNDRMIGGTSSTVSTDQDATGNDFIAGESGNDTLLGDNAKFGSIILIGGTGNDTLLGGAGDDLIYGQGGNDVGEGGSGNDTIFGDTGNDTLRGQGDNDYVEGGSGSDVILGGSGDDNLIGGASLTPAAGPGLEGGTDDNVAGIGDLIVGDSGNDVILGDNGTITGAIRDVATDPSGGAGSDSLYGGSGDDVVFGGGQGDLIVGDAAGGSGLDILVGDQGTRSATAIVAAHSAFAGSGGADTMSGSGGADVVLGGDDADLMSGDSGNDVLVGDNGQVSLSAGVVSKVETAASDSAGGNDTITGGNDADIALGGVGSDSIDGGADAASDVLLGDSGLVDFTTDANLATLDLIRSYPDGSGAADNISGGAGGDVLIGGTGGDTLYGDNASASSDAADGADILVGDNADIFLQGFSGKLLVQVAGRAQGSAVRLIQTTDTSGASGGADTISGNAGSDIALGGVGADVIYGDAATPVNVLDGDDILLGDGGEVNFAANGDADLNTLDLLRSYLGQPGASDTISGNAGRDIALGGIAGDTIYGDNATASAGALDGNDILLGDNADIVLVDPATHGGLGGDAIGIYGGAVATIVSTDVDTTTGGSDAIAGNAGGDVLVGGVLSEVLYGDAATPGAFDGNDVILGDNGRLEWLYAGDASFAAIETGLPGAFDNSVQTLDLITTTLPTSHPGGRDTIFGDAGSDVAFGGEYADTIFGDDGSLAGTAPGGEVRNDILFGDHGRIYPHRSALANFASRNFFAIDTGNGAAGEGDRIWGEAGDDVILGEQGDDRLFGGGGGDDIVGGGNVAGAIDELATPDISATLDAAAGTAVNDLIDGGSGDDAIAADNATIWRTASRTSLRFQVLAGTAIYSSTDTSETVNVTGAAQSDPNAAAVGRDITLLDHTPTTPSGLYGRDVVAGGAGNDLLFGELGDDLLQGDGLLANAPAAGIVSRPIFVADTGASLPNTAQTLYFNVPEAASDGDDYIEGNGGSDLIYGGLGQDDIIGGSSGLFGLTSSSMRPDAGDTIFGGAATPAQLARNSAGTSGVDSHARDADVIVGDNGDIYRLVGVNGASSGNFLTFNYDATFGSDVRGSLRIVPRAVQLLDYTLGGPDTNPAQAALDQGGNDLIHGEGGDDIAYGMKGDDVLYGEGQNDDLIGGYGNDWMSGGTGDDGVVGDDGRLMTSRNGLTEPLNGINVATAQQTISTPGNIQLATINVTGTLTKSVNLTPFSNDPTWNAVSDEFGGVTHRNADDIIFGGLGNDTLHGGSGDDAISGAEALVLSFAPTYDPATGLPNGLVEIDYTHPVNPGNVLAFNPVDVDARHQNVTRAGEFALYDEYDPLRKILLNDNGTASKWAAGATPTGKEFFLNFDAADPAAPPAPLDATKKTDGDDAIFGDLGNDWAVGGTGRDDLYGGFGNDLLNANDDLTTHNGLNDQPVTSASYEDRAFGGAGRDVLIANTGGDRLIDWTGEFNTYLVPFAPFGMATVSRTLQPHLQDFLYALSAADGADPTRAADKASAGADPARNGEPWGELGLVLQQDAAWRDQHGGPADPQAGNIPGGQRDVLRSANFDNGSAQGFVPASGTWSVVNGRYQVAPAAGGGDAISLFNEADTVIPSYFEMQATINAVKPLAGTKANAFLIFDFQSATDFKYAGIDVSLNRLEIGHRTANGWVIDAVANVQLKAGIDYVVLLRVNGSAVTTTIGTTTLGFTFAPRIDAQGVRHGINDGIVGIGGNNAAAQIDNVIVQSPPGAITYDATVDFGSGSPASTLFGSFVLGSWQATADGRLLGSATSAPAINLIGVPVSPGSLLDIKTTLTTFGQGGVVFDYQGPNLYKFATLSSDSRQVLIGHATAGGLVIDASYAVNIAAGTDYKLEVTLRGGLVNVSLNGAVVASKLYNETVTIGGYGLLSVKGSASGQTSFAVVEVKTDDAAYAAQPAMLTAAAAPTQPARSVSQLSAADLAMLVAAAKQRWAAAGLSAAALTRIEQLDVQVASLDGLALGEAIGNTIVIDSDAAGWGWFIDRTPGDDREFRVDGDHLAATRGAAAGRIDLLSVIAHEVGHAAGLEHEASGPMEPVLAAGERNLPEAPPGAPTDAPRVRWDVPAAAPARAALAAHWQPSWVRSFVNGLGLGEDELDPTLRLRIANRAAHAEVR